MGSMPMISEPAATIMPRTATVVGSMRTFSNLLRFYHPPRQPEVKALSCSCTPCVTMSKYYQENFESYLESYKKEVKANVELMKILDDEIICAELPPVSKTKELFEVMETIKYDTDSRYKKKNNIVESDFDYITYFKKEDMLTEMRNILREEVALFFSQNKTNE
jgi:hypothetical protein